MRTGCDARVLAYDGHVERGWTSLQAFLCNSTRTRASFLGCRGFFLAVLRIILSSDIMSKIVALLFSPRRRRWCMPWSSCVRHGLIGAFVDLRCTYRQTLQRGHQIAVSPVTVVQRFGPCWLGSLRHATIPERVPNVSRVSQQRRRIRSRPNRRDNILSL